MNETPSPWRDARSAARYVGRKAPNAYKNMLLLARTGQIKAGHNGRTFQFRDENLDEWLLLRAKKKVAR